MQDHYVGDIGNYGKYGLLRCVADAGLRLAVNWYRVIPTRPGKQEDGKYTSYLDKPEIYRHYDPELFDCLADIVHRQKRSIEEIEASGVLTAAFFSDALVPANRSHWHQAALASTIGTDIVFLDPDNGLETARMHERRSAKEKHVIWQEVKDYYDRGQSVILYQHRPQITKKTACIQSVRGFQNSFLHADRTLLLEYPRYTNRYYFIFAHHTHLPALEGVYRTVAQTWKGLCNPVEFNWHGALGGIIRGQTNQAVQEDTDMNKQEIYALLDEKNIWHEVTEHKAVYNMAEVAEIQLPYPEADAKNLFIRDDKKRNYFLITVKGNKRVDLKAFRQQNGTRPLTFASDQDLMDTLGLIPGAVTPLGLLNDRVHKVTFWLDKSFLEDSGLIGVHPNDNTATVWLKTQDLLRLLEEDGTQITLFEA